MARASRRSLAQLPWRSLRACPASVTVSLGPGAGEAPLDGTSLHAQADDALYAAKRNGRDRIETATLLATPLRIVR